MQEALAYHARHQPQALLAMRGGKLVLEQYDGGFAKSKPHALYSGTKSFWGPLALIAQRDKLLRLDEPVGETFAEWRDDPVKRQVTLRHLLTLTAGIGFGGLGKAVPLYEKALATPLRDIPGSSFTYGGVPLQIFGAVLAKKLTPLGLSPHDYLRERLLQPAAVEVASWRSLADRTKPLPTGAFLTAANWLRYGEYVREHADEFAKCFRGTQANPRYGICWWLAPPETFYASGSGGQALYVIPSQQLVVARFGNGGSFKHDAFLKRLSNG